MAELPTLVLLHGLGANRHVWDGVTRIMEAAGGTVYAPDIRGHGEAVWRVPYTFGAMAADVAEALRREYGERPFAVVGHSMGGAVALALASGWFGPPPVGAATVGVKLRWSDDELARMPDLAARPPRLFDDRAGAVDWFLKLSGLFGVIDADDERIAAAVTAGVTSDSDSPGRWRTAQDPATIGVGPPDMSGLLPAAKCTVAMAIGEHDPLVAPDHHADLAAVAATNAHAADVTEPHVFDGLGHNAMVENPQRVVDWLATLPGFADVL
ncbi:alpha/beta fold hydrolase [Candidatus Poriferisodalis sp.]|uniref:alpha/beta fold hydrolase n=1 Tax=Candidatus Poriferisodalis sp. TaxID=3101277 RepID=UPI003B02C935